MENSKRWEYQITLPVSWEICLRFKRVQLEPDMEQRTASKLVKEYIRLYIVTLLFNLYAEHIMQNTGLEEAQAESRLLGEISITSVMQMIPPLWQKVKKN